MIADLDETIRRLLIRELPVKNGEIDIKFNQPAREWSARLQGPTLNLYLYDVRENNTLRQHQWQQLGSDDDQARMKRTPLRVDCTYMMTAWAKEPEDEHRLLTRAMLALFRFPILPEESLVGMMKDQPFELQGQLARHDRLTNPAEVWSSLDNEMRPSVSYQVTLALDPWAEVSGPIVRTVTWRTGQAEAPTRRQKFVNGTAETNTAIGGTVTRRGKPQAGVRVVIEGTGFAAASDEAGRFVLGMFPPGEYTLVASPESGPPTRKPVRVPGPDYQIEI